jgi:hypothetical protein
MGLLGLVLRLKEEDNLLGIRIIIVIKGEKLINISPVSSEICSNCLISGIFWLSTRMVSGKFLRGKPVYIDRLCGAGVHIPDILAAAPQTHGFAVREW